MTDERLLTVAVDAALQPQQETPLNGPNSAGIIATPTYRLRWVERKAQLNPFYRSSDGGPAFATATVLQQWWQYDLTGAAASGKLGEWRDVPVETEEIT